MNFSSLLVAITSNLVSRAMTTLSLGFISYQSIEVLARSFQNYIFSSYALVDPLILSLLNLSGFGQSLHIITAAFIAKAGMMAIKHIGVVSN